MLHRLAEGPKITASNTVRNVSVEPFDQIRVKERQEPLLCCWNEVTCVAEIRAGCVKGEGLVSFKEDSVVIDRFTSRDGKELSKLGNGKPDWKEGSFPKVSDDANLASFSIELWGDLMGKIEGGTLEGSVTMFAGGETDKGDGTLSKGAKPVEIGPFKVSIGKPGVSA